MSSPMRHPPQTPSAAALIKPPMSEMHPSKVHPGTMAAPSSALRLGFTDIKPKAPSASTPGIGAQQSTPSKSNVPSSPFNYQFARNPQSVDSSLGVEAQRMMDEIRDQAAKIKADLVAQRDKERQEDAQVNARKIAHPKGKTGRYSAVHMTEFKKMDSIENHPSAFRAVPGRVTPGPATGSVKGTGIKRSQSRANLDDIETSQTKASAKTPSSKSKPSMLSKKAPPQVQVQTPSKGTDSPAKRTKKHADDDASTHRPMSRDESNIPKPKTPGKNSRGIPRAKTIANLMSPTQSSLARAATTNSPSVPRSILKTPSKAALTGLKKSVTASDFGSVDINMKDAPARVRSPSRFDRVKSIFSKHMPTASAPKSAVPKPVVGASMTPAPARAQNELPPAPFTTPGKKFGQRVQFTPAPKHAALAQQSPSPVKTGNPRSKATVKLVNYPSLDGVMEGAGLDNVSYPNLSGVRPLPELPTKSYTAGEALEQLIEKAPELPVAVPGNFTFRSDHTIRFGDGSPNGFGGNSGQSSVRQVRPSIMPAMPGAFPFSDAPKMVTPRGKENVPPYAQQSFDPKTFAHGMSSKKRYRIEDDEEEAEREASERAAKKMRSAAVPEGDALVAPRLATAQRGHGIRSPSKIMKKSPIKSRIPAPAASPAGGPKTGGISMSRLAYLAQPKQRR